MNQNNRLCPCHANELMNEQGTFQAITCVREMLCEIKPAYWHTWRPMPISGAVLKVPHCQLLKMKHGWKCSRADKLHHHICWSCSHEWTMDMLLQSWDETSLCFFSLGVWRTDNKYILFQCFIEYECIIFALRIYKNGIIWDSHWSIHTYILKEQHYSSQHCWIIPEFPLQSLSSDRTVPGMYSQIQVPSSCITKEICITVSSHITDWSWWSLDFIIATCRWCTL